jgi:hypothetical protein
MFVGVALEWRERTPGRSKGDCLLRFPLAYSFIGGSGGPAKEGA